MQKDTVLQVEGVRSKKVDEKLQTANDNFMHNFSMVHIRLLQIAEKVPILKDRINGNLLYPQKVLEEGVKDSNVAIGGRLQAF